MGYTAWSVVYGEQPSAAKWNILGQNDASFNDGSGIQDKNYQTDNNNSIANVTDASIKLQMGWGQVLGDLTSALETTVTFPEAYTTLLGASVCLLPVKATTSASSITDLTQDYSTVVANAIVAAPISTSGFNVLLQRASGTFSNATYYGYSWIAWGLA